MQWYIKTLNNYLFLWKNCKKVNRRRKKQIPWRKFICRWNGFGKQKPVYTLVVPISLDEINPYIKHARGMKCGINMNLEFELTAKRSIYVYIYYTWSIYVCEREGIPLELHIVPLL